MSRQPVWITGVGLLTPLGNSAWATMRALLEGRTITDRLADLHEPLQADLLVRGTGRIPDSQLGVGDPTATLATRALHEAVCNAGWTTADLARTPIIVASSKGAIGALLNPMTRMLATTLGPHEYLCSLIRAQTGASSCRAVVAACASGLFALDLALRMIQRGETPRVAVVGVEASLVPLLIASYRRLGVLPPTTAQAYRCLPLDTNRCGFTLTELAAAVILDSNLPHASPRPATAIAPMRLLGVRTAGQAHHMIKSPVDAQVLIRLSTWACNEFGSIDLLHPHATGTVENDKAEMRVHADALGAAAESTPAYAVKGAIGHGLGAAGLASVVIAAMIARCGRLPPMPWLADPIATPLRITRPGERGTFKRHAIFASGFGGHTAAAVIESQRERHKPDCRPHTATTSSW